MRISSLANVSDHGRVPVLSENKPPHDVQFHVPDLELTRNHDYGPWLRLALK